MLTPRIREGQLYLGNDILSLKSFKYMPSLSEETNCFTASVFWNGYKIGIAENRGNGGQTAIHPDQKNKDVYEAASLAIKVAQLRFKNTDNSELLSIATLDVAVDFLVDSLIMAKSAAKEIKKLDKADYFLVGLKRNPNGEILYRMYAPNYSNKRNFLEKNPEWPVIVETHMTDTKKNYDLVINRSMPDFHEKYLGFFGLNKEVELVSMTTVKPRNKAG